MPAGRRPRPAVAVAVVAWSPRWRRCANVTVLTVSHAGDTDGVTPDHDPGRGHWARSAGSRPPTSPRSTTGAAVYFDQLNASGGVYGRKIVYSPIVDDGTSPSGNTAGAQRLVQSKVFAVVGVGTPFFTGSSILRSQAVPDVRDPGEHQRPVVGTDHVRRRRLATSPTDLPMPQVAYVAQQTHARAAAVLAYNVAQSSGGCVSRGQGPAAVPRAHPGDRLLDPLRGGHPGRRRDPDAAGRGRLRGHLHGRHRQHQAVPDPPAARHGVGHPVLARRLRHAASSTTTRPPSTGAYFLLQQTPFEVTDARPGRLPGHRRLQRRPAALRAGHHARRARRWPAG